MGRRGCSNSTSARTCVATLLFGCVGVLAVTGCVSRTPLPDGEVTQATHDKADGWRLGVIVRLGAALPDPGTVDDDCRVALAPSVREASAFAEFAYRQGRRSRLRIVMIERDSAWSPGDEASIDLRDCQQAAVRNATPRSDAPSM